MNNNFPSSNGHISITRGRVDNVEVYDVTKEELELIIESKGGNLESSFAFSSFSIAITSLAALFSSDFIQYPNARIIFISLVICGIVLGSYFIYASWRSKKPIERLISKIKSRLNGPSSHQSSSKDVNDEIVE